MLISHGRFRPETKDYEFTSQRNEELQSICNHLKFELKDHNYSLIRPGFVSRTLVEKNFSHTINSLHFLIKGSAEMTFENKKIQLREGDIFLIGNQVKCTWEYACESVEVTLLFNLYLGNFEDLFTSLSQPLILHSCFEDVGKIQSLFEADNCFAALEIENHSLKYLFRFLKMTDIDLLHHINTVKKYGDVFRYIDENLSMSLRLKDIAQNHNYSIGFLTKSFVADNHMTVKQYIHNKLMSEIEQLLIYSDLPLSKISDQYGFCELSYFTRWFKKNKGSTPSIYRKRLKQEVMR
ncbi:MAG: AraC family transcriptional regulator [Clostridia bacterium]|nr:AraC family transcriptional regulator [Clostridia bacterium]